MKILQHHETIILLETMIFQETWQKEQQNVQLGTILDYTCNHAASKQKGE